MRTLERKLGALCRAVAVRVAEMNVDNSVDVTDKDSGRKKLPIYLDDTALEDILGVIVTVLLFGACTFLPSEMLVQSVQSLDFILHDWKIGLISVRSVEFSLCHYAQEQMGGGCVVTQAVNHWYHYRGLGSMPGYFMWDLW